MSENGESKEVVEKRRDKNLWNNLGKLCALILMVVYAVYIANTFAKFMPEGHVAFKILKAIMFYGPLVLIVLNCFEWAADKNLIIRIIIIVVWAAIIILSFFPSALNFLIK